MSARPLVCSVLVVVAAAVGLAPARASADWSNFGGDPARTGAVVSPSLEPPFDVLWSKTFPASVDSNWPAQPFVSYPVIGNGEVFAVTWRVVDNAQVFQINAFDEQTGATLWTYSDTDDGAVAVQLALDGSRLFADGTDQGVIAFDATTGHILWTHPARGWSPLVATGGVVYFTDFGVGAQQYALDESTGSQLWMTRMFSPTMDGPVVGNGLVYLVGGDVWDGRGTTWPDGYALDQTTGAIVWRDTWSDGEGDDGCSFTATLSDGQLWSSECGLNEFDQPNGDRLDPATGVARSLRRFGLEQHRARWQQ